MPPRDRAETTKIPPVAAVLGGDIWSFADEIRRASDTRLAFLAMSVITRVAESRAPVSMLLAQLLRECDDIKQRASNGIPLEANDVARFALLLKRLQNDQELLELAARDLQLWMLTHGENQVLQVCVRNLHQRAAVAARQVPQVTVGEFTLTAGDDKNTYIYRSNGEGGLFNTERLAKALGEFYDREF